MQTTEEKKHSGSVLLVMILVLLLSLLLFVGYFFVFRINQFSLEIRLLGNKDNTIALGEEFSDPGAQVFLRGSLLARDGFQVDADLHTVNRLDNSAPGSYHISYDAGWHGLSAAGSRQVVVEDRIPPTITLITQPGYYTIPGEEYVEEGFSAWDNWDGDLSAYVTRLQEGDLVTYTVSDSAGNRSSVSRRIYYFDPVAPDLTLLGEGTVYVSAGVGFTEPGWVAVDNGDGDISDRVQVSGEVDRYLAGSYKIEYSVVDDTGNRAEATRTVVVEPKEIPKTVMPEGKVIYLTFDDGPGPYTMDLLKVLEKYNVKATFFVIGSGYDDVIREIVKAGHSIGIHSVSHEYKRIYASSDAYFQDLLTMQKRIRDLTGVETWLMRFPGGSSNTVSCFNPGIMTYLTQAVQDNGFQYFDWNVDSNDAGGAKKAEEVFENVKAGVQNRSVSIVLQHDVKGFSVDAVEKIIRWALDNGYQFLPLDMSSPCAHHGVNN